MKLTQSMVDEILEVGQEALNKVEEKYPIGTEVEIEVTDSFLGTEVRTHFEQEARGSMFRVKVEVFGTLGLEEAMEAMRND